MNLDDLQQYHGEMTLDFEGDGVEYFDYTLTITEKYRKTQYTLDRTDLDELIEGTELFLKKLKGLRIE
jgi:hypothetical protein